MTTPESEPSVEPSVPTVVEVTREFKTAAELNFIQACFESLVYVAPEDIARLQAQIATSLSRLAGWAGLVTASRSAQLSPLSDAEVSAIAAGFSGSISQLVRDAANAQRIKADFELSKVG
jgi:hypothetical protein